MPLSFQPKGQSQAFKLAPFALRLPLHPPNRWFKVTHLSLIIPNLAAPLHYLNLRVMMGQPNIPIFKNKSNIANTALDTVNLLCSSSPHMLGHVNHFSMSQDCILKNNYYQFGEHAYLSGEFPKFHVLQHDSELNIDLNIQTLAHVSYPLNKKIGFYEHWSVMSQCEGEIKFKNQTYQIEHLGSFEYSRAVNLPYFPMYFYTYQVIQLKDLRQILLLQVRNQFNQVLQSKILIRDLEQEACQRFERSVYFKIHRVYPKVKTPNHLEMYLPREFEWYWSDGSRKIHIIAHSRGDFKFGLGAGFVGSFKFQIEIDDYVEEGQAGYCEYIDCRPLHWQEMHGNEKSLIPSEQVFPVALKHKD